MADVHVVPEGDSWKVTSEGDTISTHRTQQDAITAGRAEAKNRSCELDIHGEGGEIRAKDSEGDDPPKIPG